MISEAPRETLSIETEQARIAIAIIEAPEGYPEGVRILKIRIGEDNQVIVPVFNVRDERHHESIAQLYATYQKAVVFGVGLYGAAVLVESPRLGINPNSREALKKIKPDRSDLDKIPMYVHPKDAGRIIDFDRVHEEFLPYIKTREARENFYKKGVAIHLIAPVRKENPHIDNIFITYPEDWKAKKVPRDQWIDAPTASLFWWNDPDQEQIYLKTQRLNPRAFAGISSFNDHGEEPAWDFSGVLKYVENKERVPFDFVVTDPVNEIVGVKSSHPQIALPLKGEDPVWKVYRTGSTDIESFLQRLGSRHKYKEVEGARQAVRAHPKETNLDLLVQRVYLLTSEDYNRRHPPKSRLSVLWEKLAS